MMRIAILTTQTPHHAFFVRELANAAIPALIVAETRPAKAPFPTDHPYEIQRDQHERETFFGGTEPPLGDFGPVIETPSVNDTGCIAALRKAKPDMVIDFGTGKVGSDLIGLWPDCIVNLHGGDPEHYRGLDSHLWTIYHRDFDALVTTLHRLNAELDAGEIVSQTTIEVPRNAKLHELRRLNTQACVQLALTAIAMMQQHGKLLSRPQRQRGRYYSFMPAVLKESCVTQFEKFTGWRP